MAERNQSAPRETDAWAARRGILLGTVDCKQISMEELTRLGFTVEEANRIIKADQKTHDEYMRKANEANLFFVSLKAE